MISEGLLQLAPSYYSLLLALLVTGYRPKISKLLLPKRVDTFLPLGAVQAGARPSSVARRKNS